MAKYKWNKKIGSIFISSNANTSVISNENVQILINWINAVAHGCINQKNLIGSLLTQMKIQKCILLKSNTPLQATGYQACNAAERLDI